MNFTRLVAAIAISTGIIAGVTACSTDGDNYARVCENPATQQRVADSQCTTTHPTYIWIYIAATHKAPGVGKKITAGTGTRSLPKGGSIEEAPIHGGVIEEPHVNAPVEHAPAEEPIHITIRG